MRRTNIRATIHRACISLCHAFLGVSLLTLFAGCEGKKPDVVRIGIAVPLTGHYAPIGHDVRRAVELAVDETNEQLRKSGEPNRRFLSVAYDDHADPDQAISVAKRLINEQVNAVVGHLNSGTTIVTAPLYAKANIPQFVTSATNPGITSQGFRTIFRLVPTDEKIAHSAVEYMLQRFNPARIAILDDGTFYGKGLAEEFSVYVKEKAVARRHLAHPNQSIQEEIQVLRQLAPDFIFFAGDESLAGKLARQVREAKLTSHVMSAEVNADENFIMLAGIGAEGFLNWRFGLPLDQLPLGQNFLQRYTARFGVQPGYQAAFAYDAAKTFLNAVIATSTTETSLLLPAIRATDYQGITGKISFVDSGDLKSWSLSLVEVINGKWELKSIKRGQQ